MTITKQEIDRAIDKYVSSNRGATADILVQMKHQKRYRAAYGILHIEGVL